MLLNVPNVRQRQQADCLAACAQMVLTYLGEQVDYNRLLRILDTTENGTPFSNIRRLTSLGLFVEQDEYIDDLTLVAHYLDLRLPIIIGVKTWGLSYWRPIDTNHAVVIVGLSDSDIYINDPAFDEAPKVIKEDDFLYAWLGHDFRYAIIGLIAPG
ncbi:MAG: cysteine peptidase family C39 domain-containing protein [Chloroflexota bacterium]